MSSAKIGSFLESRGWTRRIAGDADFDAAVAAVGEMAGRGIGLVVSGEYGSGKTALVNALVQAYGEPFRVRLALPADLQRLRPDWQEYWAANPYGQNVFLDDLGAEPMTNEYGVRLEAAGDFIVSWHELARPGRRLFVTTNLTTAEIDERYGGRVLSRLKDLCVPLRLAGPDKRKWTLPQKGAAR